jgi:hypothetical protein
VSGTPRCTGNAIGLDKRTAPARATSALAAFGKRVPTAYSSASGAQMPIIIGKASVGRSAVTRNNFIAVMLVGLQTGMFFSVMLVGLHTGMSFWANAPVTLGKTAAYWRNDLR